MSSDEPDGNNRVLQRVFSVYEGSVPDIGRNGLSKGGQGGMSMEVKRTGRKHAEWKIAVIVTSGLLLAVGIFLFYFKVYQVAPVFSEATYEYGTRISREITDYISGTEWSVNLGELDLSGVNEGRTGTYEAVVRHGGSRK